MIFRDKVIEAYIADEQYFTAQDALVGRAANEGQMCVQHISGLDQIMFCVLTFKDESRVSGSAFCCGGYELSRDDLMDMARLDAIRSAWMLLDDVEFDIDTGEVVDEGDL